LKGEKRMKKITSLAIIVILCLSTFSMIALQTKAEPDETPLEVAEKAACYVIGQAVPENGGCKWSDRTDDVARVGDFLVLLHEKTGNSTYLDYAKCAAQWLISKAFPSAGGYMWWLDGWRLSSTVYYVGEFLLKMYKVTGNSTYFDYAKGAAQWMVAMAEPEDGGLFIPYNPPGKFGSQAAHGISPGREAQTVTFLLHMYQETGNTTYLTYVKGMAEWLISGPDKEVEYGGYKWRHNRPYSSIYPFGTNAMIAHFFYETYQELGNATYLEHANGIVQWILSQAVPDDGGYKWPRFPGTTDYYLLPLMEYPFYHVNDLLLVGYSITSNSTYLEYAKKHADWVLSQAISESGGYKFPYVEGDSRYDAYQNARAYNFLSWMSDVTGEASYSGYADGALTWIINNATVTDGCYKWKTIPSPPYYPWLFSGGASGIGYYLISAPSPVSRAYINIDPDTLNLKSQGKWITAYIELPEGYDVSDIDVSTVMLNGEIQAELHPTEIGDYDTDGIPDLMVKFSRADLISSIYHTLGIRHENVTLTITGQLADGTPFEGSYNIEVMFGGDADLSGYVETADFFRWRENFGKTPDQCPPSVYPDFDDNGLVETNDFFIWRENFGATIPSPP
jgi:rhamnogalacturonyl hydrolase YesR